MSGLFGSKKQTIGYKYFLGMHHVLCHSIDTLNKIYVDKKEAWSGRLSENAAIGINKNELFGGDRSEGGVSGVVEVMFGKSDQGPSAYLSSQVPGGLPNFRGVVSVVLNQMYLGTSSYLKNWSYRATRVYTWDRWYDAKAPIGDEESYFGENEVNSPKSVPIRVAILMDKSYSMNMQVAGQRKWFIAEDIARRIKAICIDLEDKGYSVSFFFGMYNDYGPMVSPIQAGNAMLFNTGGAANIDDFNAPGGGPSKLVQDIYYPGQEEMKMPAGIDGPNIGMRENMYVTRPWDGRYLQYLDSESYIRNTEPIADFFKQPGASNNGVIIVGNLKIGARADLYGIFQDYYGRDYVPYLRAESEFGKACESGLRRYYNYAGPNDDSTYWNVTKKNTVKLMVVSINTDKDEECEQPFSPTYPYQQDSETKDVGPTQYNNNPYVSRNLVGPGGRGRSKAIADFKRMMQWDFEDDGTGISSGGNVYDADMNPAHIIRECLTNPTWGMGYPAVEIDDTAFRAAADLFFDEKLGMSLTWDKEMSIEDFIRDILRHIDAVLYTDRRTGLFILKPIRKDYNAEDLITLNESNVLTMSEFSKPTLGELANSVTVNTWDKATDTTASATVQNSALYMIQGAEINTKIQYPGITNKKNAIRLAQRDLRSLSTSLVKCTIETTDVAEGLNLGDVFKLTWADYEINELVMRVMGIAYGTDKKHRVRIQCVQDVFSTPTAPLVSVPEIPWVDPSNNPTTPVLNGIALEAPYYELVQQLGQVQVDANLNASPEMGLALISAIEPTNANFGVVYTQDPVTSNTDSIGTVPFSQFAQLIDPVWYLDDVLNVAVSDLSAAKINTGEWAWIENEIILIQSKSRVSDGVWTLTVKRGCLDTQPKILDAGARIYFVDAYNLLYIKDYTYGENIQFDISAVGNAGETDATSRFNVFAQFKARAFAPYPPQNVKINGEYYNTDALSSIEVTWAYRNRRQQTGYDLLGFTDGSLSAAEPGTTFSVRIYDNVSQTFLYTASGITGTSHVVPNSSIPFEYSDLTIFVISTREGKDCMHPFQQTLFLAPPIGGMLVFEMDDSTTPPAGGSITFNL